ncbi:hypothetical protein ET33_34450 [Paenibacillus tyrfis]|uniref:Uncharacterized protein n=1 Tax=Paenibacillus tyrfis TaxID=1501230 RepID=A0A081NT98_9BACL|nr:hypothetical protein ET33_34450 [Paenibacillus tyrfis]
MGIFWTRQKEEAWEYAKEIGYFEGNQKYIPSTHIEAYKWMMEQMEMRLQNTMENIRFGCFYPNLKFKKDT